VLHLSESLLASPKLRIVSVVAAVLVLAACSAGSPSTDIDSVPPDVAEGTLSIQSFSTLNEQAADNLASCLNDKGWPEVTHVGGGQFDYGPLGLLVTPEFEEAEAECSARYPLLGFGSVMTETAWVQFFTAAVENARCRESLGIAITEPPSVQTLVDWAMQNDAVWGPWDPTPQHWNQELEEQADLECGHEPFPLDFVVN